DAAYHLAASSQSVRHSVRRAIHRRHQLRSFNRPQHTKFLTRPLPLAPHDDVPLPQMPEIPALPALPDSSSVAPPLQGDGTAPGSASWPAPPQATPGEPASSVQRAP
ncbi:hypothetical protein QZN17_20045, partial [Burkholderia multivorans]|nr:hypothetical protein [Burkholderia multivorans]